MGRRLNVIEEKELKRLENMKNLAIDEMIGKCDLINEMMKEVRTGSWYCRMKGYSNFIEKEREEKK